MARCGLFDEDRARARVHALRGPAGKGSNLRGSLVRSPSEISGWGSARIARAFPGAQTHKRDHKVKRKTNSTLNSQPHPRHSTQRDKRTSHPLITPKSTRTRGGRAHEKQNDPVAQSSMYQRRHPTSSHPQLTCPRGTSKKIRSSKKRRQDTEVFEEVEVARLSRSKSSVSPPPGHQCRHLDRPRHYGTCLRTEHAPSA